VHLQPCVLNTICTMCFLAVVMHATVCPYMKGPGHLNPPHLIHLPHHQFHFSPFIRGCKTAFSAMCKHQHWTRSASFSLRQKAASGCKLNSNRSENGEKTGSWRGTAVPLFVHFSHEAWSRYFRNRTFNFVTRTKWSARSLLPSLTSPAYSNEDMIGQR
jgi:hypothetical protein